MLNASSSRLDPKLTLVTADAITSAYADRQSKGRDRNYARRPIPSQKRLGAPSRLAVSRQRAGPSCDIVTKTARAPLFGAPIDNLRRRPTGRWRRVCDRQLLPRDLERSRLLGPLLVWIAAALESNREGLVRFVDRVGAEAGDPSLDGRLVLFRRALHAALGGKFRTVGAQDVRGIVTAFRKDRETYRTAPHTELPSGPLVVEDTNVQAPTSGDFCCASAPVPASQAPMATLPASASVTYFFMTP